MYQVIAKSESMIPIKPYWCETFSVANKVTNFLRKRFESVSYALAKLNSFTCYEDLKNAIAHQQDGVVMIRSDKGILCLDANDSFWQRLYDHDKNC